MDPKLDWAIRIFLVVAAVASAVLVLLYRWRDVPLRRALIAKACKGLKERSKRVPAAAELLAKTESDPDTTFDRYHSYGRYVWPLFNLVILQAAVCFVLYRWLRCYLDPAGASYCASIQERLPAVVVMALAGGMVWTLQQAISRTYDGELGPPDLDELVIGLMSAVPIGYAFSLTVDESSRLGPLLAFGASAFPVRETARMIRGLVTRRMLESTEKSVVRSAERHLGTAIDGVSDEALSRLKELRITTVLDIAYSDPVKVMVETGFPLMVIVDWIDQAIWALYAGDKKNVMTTHGIRCSLDVCEFVDMHLRAPDRSNSMVKSPDLLTRRHKAALDAAAARMEVDGQMLMDLFFRIYNDPQVLRLRQLWYPEGVPADLRSGAVFFDAPDAEDLERDEATWDLYEDSFPSSEREPRAVIVKTVRDGVGLVVRSRSDGITTGFSFVHLLKGPPPTVFLVYLAVQKEYRSRGLGAELLEQTWQQASTRQAREGLRSSGMIWEVEIPEEVTDDERRTRERRIAFFERQGASLLPARYEQPPVDGKASVRMHLMFRPPRGSLPDSPTTRSLVDAIYSEKYSGQNGIARGVLDELRTRFVRENQDRLTPFARDDVEAGTTVATARP